MNNELADPLPSACVPARAPRRHQHGHEDQRRRRSCTCLDLNQHIIALLVAHHSDYREWVLYGKHANDWAVQYLDSWLSGLEDIFGIQRIRFIIRAANRQVPHLPAIIVPNRSQQGVLCQVVSEPEAGNPANP